MLVARARILPLLEAGEFLLGEDGFMGPPGFDDLARIHQHTADGLENPAFKAHQFSQHCLARQIAWYAQGLRRNDTLAQIQMRWRARCAHKWSTQDPEHLLFPMNRGDDSNSWDNLRNGSNGGGGGGGAGSDNGPGVHLSEEAAFAFAVELARQTTRAELYDVDGPTSYSSARVTVSLRERQ